MADPKPCLQIKESLFTRRFHERGQVSSLEYLIVLPSHSLRIIHFPPAIQTQGR